MKDHRSPRRVRMLSAGTAGAAIIAAFAAGTACAADPVVAGRQNLVNTQQAPSADVHAATDSTNGNGWISADGVNASTLNAGGNTARATSVANSVQQALPIERNTIVTAGVNVAVFPTAAVVEGVLTSNGAYNVVNGQDVAGGSVAAAGGFTAAGIRVSGDAKDAALKIEKNAALMSATGNAAHNDMSLNGSTVTTAGGVNSLQTLGANVAATVGNADAPTEAAIRIGGSVDGGAFSVTGNSSDASATGNTAANSLAVEGGTLHTPRFVRGASAGTLITGIGADADAALSNVQRVDLGRDLSVSSTTEARFAIDAGSTVHGSSLTVDGNSLSTQTVGNTATSKLTVKATEMPGSFDQPAFTSALSSDQATSGVLSASSHMIASAPSSVERSSVTLSNNSNGAIARMNDAQNVASVEVVGITGIGSVPPYGGADGTSILQGDHVLSNEQSADGGIRSLAKSDVVSQPINSARFTIEGNRTAAETTANRALNSLSVNALSNRDARVALGNVQFNDASVISTATTVLNAGNAGALQSTLSITDNANSALSRGNVAENRLFASAGPGTGDGGEGGGMPAFAMAYANCLPVSGQGTVLSNRQDNGAAITAIATGTGAVPSGGAADGSQLFVRGNSVSASGYGNVALNAATVEGGSEPASVLVRNDQVNHGSVYAHVVDAAPGIGVASVGNSKLGIISNIAVATAVGNQSVNSIGSGH